MKDSRSHRDEKHAVGIFNIVTRAVLIKLEQIEPTGKAGNRSGISIGNIAQLGCSLAEWP